MDEEFITDVTQNLQKLTRQIKRTMGPRWQGRSNRSGHSGLGRCTFRPVFDHTFRWCTPYCNLRVALHTVTVT